MEEVLDLAVIESRWWERGNDSVRGPFDMLAGLHCDNPFAYHYEMFNSASSLQDIIERVAHYKHVRNIYIGAHGSDTDIRGPGDVRIRPADIGDALEQLLANTLDGLFFSCCGFGEQIENLAERADLTWIAGYTENIDWIDAAAMDLYFWNAYYQSSVACQTTKRGRACGMDFLLRVLEARVPYLFSELGFRVAVSRRKGSCRMFPDDEDEFSHMRADARAYVRDHPSQWP